MGESGGDQLREIGYFRVTHRGLDDYEKFCHIDRNSIGNGATVVDVGSGWNQELSRDLEEMGKGIKTVSLDASLAIPPEGLDGVKYQTNISGEVGDVTEEMARERLLAKQDGSVAAIMPDIPLKSDSADLVVDCFGPGTYLDDEGVVKYVGEVVRVLKDGGSARVYPIDSYDDFCEGESSERAIISGQRRLALLNSDEGGAKFEYFLQEDSDGVQRVGLVVEKGPNKI